MCMYHLCTTACHLQKASPYLLSGGGKGSSGPLKLGSGRSPYIARLQSPLTVTSQKRSKSVSPPLLGRISPFSQTVHTNSWSTFFSAEESAALLDPLLPQLCLHRQCEMDGPQERLDTMTWQLWWSWRYIPISGHSHSSVVTVCYQQNTISIISFLGYYGRLIQLPKILPETFHPSFWCWYLIGFFLIRVYWMAGSVVWCVCQLLRPWPFHLWVWCLYCHPLGNYLSTVVH